MTGHLEVAAGPADAGIASEPALAYDLAFVPLTADPTEGCVGRGC